MKPPIRPETAEYLGSVVQKALLEAVHHVLETRPDDPLQVIGMRLRERAIEAEQVRARLELVELLDLSTTMLGTLKSTLDSAQECGELAGEHLQGVEAIQSSPAPTPRSSWASERGVQIGSSDKAHGTASASHGQSSHPEAALQAELEQVRASEAALRRELEEERVRRVVAEDMVDQLRASSKLSGAPASSDHSDLGMERRPDTPRRGSSLLGKEGGKIGRRRSM